MNDKQFREELKILGLRGHDENVLRTIVDGLSRQLPVRQISQSAHVTEKTIAKMRPKAFAIADLLTRKDRNSASDVNEQSYVAYQSDLQKHMDINRRTVGIQNSRYDIYGEQRLKILEELEQRVTQEKWNVQYLKMIGFKENMAIAMISEHDRIELYRDWAVQIFQPIPREREYEERVAKGIFIPSVKQQEAPSPVIKLAMFTSFNRYVELFYDVIFQEINQMADEIPGAYSRTAKQIIIKGLYDDPLAVKTGEAIIRFSIWRSQIYKDGFVNSLRPWKSTKQQLDRYIASIDKMILANKMYLETKH